MASNLSTDGASLSVIRRKLGTLSQNPVGVIRTKTFTGARRILQEVYKYKLRQHGVFDTILAFLQQRSPTTIPPDFADLWFLYKTVRYRKPRVILEFGSGCSTAVFAQALADNQALSSQHSGYLYSVDADLYWFKDTAKSMPSHLKNFYEIIHSSLLHVDYEGTPAFQHANVPDVIPNFLYLDGPALTKERQVALDVLLMEDKLSADFFMVIDGRKTNTEFLKRHLKRKYAIRERKFFNNRVFKLSQ
jgi:hypothetical protein